MFSVGGGGVEWSEVELVEVLVEREHAIHNCELFKFKPLQNHIIHLIQTTSSLVDCCFHSTWMLYRIIHLRFVIKR